MFGLRKTLSNLFNLQKVDEQWYESLEEALLLGDVGMSATQTLISQLRREAKNQKAESDDDLKVILATFVENLLSKLERPQNPLDLLPGTSGQPTVWLIVGVNGAGKTTLFRIILDLIRPSAGEVLINGNTNVSDDWKKFTGSFLDERFLVDYLTPDEYFQFVAGLHGYTAADLDQYLSTFDELFNDEIRNKKKYIRDLSKGNLKKVGIAAAMMGNPELVLLDEPFENLDPSSQIRLKKRINQERELRKVTFLISSHDLNHVTEICNRFVILEKGKIVHKKSYKRV